MLKLTLILLLITSVTSCNNKNEGSSPDGGNFKEEFRLVFGTLATHGRSLIYSVRGTTSRAFGEIEFYQSANCSRNSILKTGGRSDLQTGITLSLSKPNNPNPIYYSISDFDKAPITTCKLLTTYLHDTIAPSIPDSVPGSLLSQNGLWVNDLSWVPQIPSSFVVNDADGVNFYGDASKTIFLGSITKDALSTGAITLEANKGNALFVSLFDLAGNESQLLDTGVVVFHDGIAPLSPVPSQSIIRYVDSSSALVMASVMPDVTSVRVSNLSSGEVLLTTPSNISLGVTLGLLVNSVNLIIIEALDAVGNISLPLSYTIISDQIAPNSPAISSGSLYLTTGPVNLATVSLALESNETGTINVYSDASLSLMVQTGTSADWMAGRNLMVTNLNGVTNFWAVAFDSAGNASQPLSFSITHDTVSPGELTLTAGTLSRDGSIQSNIKLSIAGALDSDIATVEISGGDRVEIFSMTEIVSGVDYQLLPNQLNTVMIVAIDSAGNRSSGQTLSVTHDSIPPMLTLDHPVSNGSINQGGTLAGECELGPVTINLGISQDVPCINGEWEFTLTDNRVHGSQLVISLSEADTAGNISLIYDEARIDNVAPVIIMEASTIPALSSDRNHMILGYCEDDLAVSLSGSDTQSVPCLLGYFVMVLSNAIEGVNNFTISQTDMAGNTGSTSFSMNFDFSTPATVSLLDTTQALHNTAISATSFNLRGTLTDDVPVKVYSDSMLTNLLATYTRAQFQAGVSVSLTPDSRNDFFIVTEDNAGNRSEIVPLTIYQRLSLSRRYRTSYTNLNVTTEIALGTGYQYSVTLTNTSTDTNINQKIALGSITATSGSSQVVINPTSECLTRTLAGFDSCKLTFTVTYTSTGSKSTNITIRYPDNTTQTLNVKHKVATVLGMIGPTLTTPTNLFSADLRETRGGEAFVTLQNYMDYGFVVLGTSSLARRRRVQAVSDTKYYMACSFATTRLCVYDRADPSMEEFQFDYPALSSDFETFVINDTPLVDIWYLGKYQGNDVLIVSKSRSSNYSSQQSALLVYDTVTKTGEYYTLRNGSAELSVQRPITGTTIIGNMAYFSGRWSSGQGIYRFNLDTRTYTRIVNQYNTSGYLRVNDSLIFSNTSMEVQSYSFTNNTYTRITAVDSTSTMFICSSESYVSEKHAGIDDRNYFYTESKHGVYFLCNTSKKTKGAYTDGSYHVSLRDISSAANDTMLIQNTQQISSTQALFSLIRSGSTFQIYHYYVDRTAGTLTSDTDSYSNTASSQRPAPAYINGKIYKPDGTAFREYNLSWTTLRTLHTFSDTNWFMVNSGGMPFLINNTNETVYYYDLEYSTLFTYKSLASQLTSGLSFQGFYGGFLYIKDGTSSSTEYQRLPLYPK